MALVGAWGLQLPATAGATTVSAEGLIGLVVKDQTNKPNVMSVRAELGELIFDEAGVDNTGAVPVLTALTTTAPQCRAVTAQEGRCGSLGPATLKAELGGADDTFRLDSSSSVAVILFASIDGGEGDDELVSNTGTQLVVGSAGDDTLDARADDDSGRARVRARLQAQTAGRPGKWRVYGRHSIGGSFGTTWVTEDRCDGTLTRVIAGTVRVRDLGRRRAVVVNAGEKYLARAK